MNLPAGGAVAAIDLGATSGRVMLGRVDPARGILNVERISRFRNGAVPLPSGLHWNLTGLYAHALDGLGAALRAEPNLASIGVDSWAVDYTLLRGDRVLGEPFHYRDARTAAGVDIVHSRHPFAQLYRRNGLQFLPFNTLYQLAIERENGCLDLADTVLLVPDTLAFWLTGARVAERTNASTMGLLRVQDSEWDAELIDELGLGAARFPALVSPGATIGTLRESVIAGLGAPRAVEVVAVGSHDTASAVVAVPMTDPKTAAYVSSGTWGLVGLELEQPVTTDAARAANFTNEGGVDGRIRFLHNVTGLWLLSESVRQWERESGESIDLPALISAAGAVTENIAIFDANDPRFLAPGDMPGRIAQWYRKHGTDEPGGVVPTTRAQVARAIIESLAEAFARTVRTAAGLASRNVDVIHIVGGGSQNALLCQRTADRAGVPVLAGPVEATAIGNVLVQARAHGWFGPDASLETLRNLVARAFPPTRYHPRA